jgi:hypothetical protein
VHQSARARVERPRKTRLFAEVLKRRPQIRMVGGHLIGGAR